MARRDFRVSDFRDITFGIRALKRLSYLITWGSGRMALIGQVVLACGDLAPSENVARYGWVGCTLLFPAAKSIHKYL